MGVGGERTMLLLPLRAPVFRRSNRHLHHRLADACASTIERHAGERAISASVRGNTVSFLAEGKLRRAACGTLARPLPGACVTGGIRTRICHGAKYPKSSPPASVEPRDAANRNQTNKFCRGALNGAPPLRTLLVRPAIGIRLIASFPPTGPALLAHASAA
jgi:hypothetical protein